MLSLIPSPYKCIHKAQFSHNGGDYCGDPIPATGAREACGLTQSYRVEETDVMTKLQKGQIYYDKTATPLQNHLE